MQLRSPFLSALTIAASGARGEQCGVSKPTEKQLNTSMSFFHTENISKPLGLAPRTTVPAIQVHVHVVATGETEDEGYISVSP